MDQGRVLAIALAGGGTGGHVVPGLHLLAHARAGGVATHVLWFGAGRAVEERVFGGALAEPAAAVVAGTTIERIALSLEPPGGGAPSRLRLVARTPGSVLAARHALRRSGARVLVGLGGFTVLPAVLAARSLGLAVVLLEVNAEAGLATRWLARLARHVVHAWPASVPAGASPGAPGDAGARHLVLGPPLAPAFLAPDPSDARRAELRRALGLDPERPLLLVLGGSQGALGLNRFVAEHAERLVAAGLSVLHQVGPARLTEAAPEREGYRALEFVDDVCAALDAADVVLCRGGASTLAEVAARGVPGFVVPYPHHADRHQERNARALGEGLVVVDETALGPATVQAIVALAGPAGRAERTRRGALLRAAVPRDGAARLWELVRELARG